MSTLTAPAPITDRGRPQDTTSPRVHHATAADLPRLAEVLTQAFADDPVTVWCFPDPRRRAERLGRFYAEVFLQRMAFGRDEILTDDSRRGVASWTPPGAGVPSTLDTIRLLPRLASICGGGLPRALRALAYLESHLPTEPHWHLPFLGVTPAWQGHGLGSLLLRPILERCDRETTPAYLEASTPRNRALYLRHGFEVLDEIRLPGGGPPLWRMWRDPGTEPTSATIAP